MSQLSPETHIGAVSLTVADLGRVASFYQSAIGLQRMGDGEGAVRLGAGESTLVELVADSDPPPRPAGTTGLFHLAILVPDRRELARALRRVAEAGARFSGASDHLVSEALYLSDPEGNGIEIYRDRPREEWGRRNGEIEMATIGLDLPSLAAEADEATPAMAPDTRIGHVHLQVADLIQAEAFYCGLVGFDVTTRSYPGALFISAGGYHHHIGLNTWAGEGAPAPPKGSRGLRHFEVMLSETGELDALVERLEAEGVVVERGDATARASDPSGNGVSFRLA